MVSEKGSAALESQNQDKQVRPMSVAYHEVYHAFAIPSYKGI